MSANADLKSQLNAAINGYPKPYGYKSINPETVTQDLKRIFKASDMATLVATTEEQISDMTANGQNRSAQRVRLGLQALTA